MNRRRFAVRLVQVLALAGARRTLLLSACGALLGLVLAGVTLLRRTPPPVDSVPPGYVALVNGRGILMSDFEAQIMETQGVSLADATAEQKSAVLRDMIDEELLVQRALVLDLPETTTEVRAVAALAVKAQVAMPLLAQPVTEEQLKSYYNTHKATFTASGSMELTDLVLRVGGYQNANQSVAQAETDASEAAYQLRSGADRRYIMDHFGFEDSGVIDSGGQLDAYVKMRLGDRLYQVARTLQDGQVSDPVVDAGGVHLLIMHKHVPEQIADFESARANVYQDYREDLRQRAASQNLQLLRRDARILLAPGQRE